MSVHALMCPNVCVCAESRERTSEGKKVQSSACLSGHAIQHREKPFIQHSLPAPPSKLPSNSARPEWTCWHGSPALGSPPSLCCRPDCLFSTASSSFSFCPSCPPSSTLHICAFSPYSLETLLPSSSSLYRSLLCLSTNISIYFCLSWWLPALSRHLFPSPASPFECHTAVYQQGHFTIQFSQFFFRMSATSLSVFPLSPSSSSTAHFTADQSVSHQSVCLAVNSTSHYSNYLFFFLSHIFIYIPIILHF